MAESTLIVVDQRKGAVTDVLVHDADSKLEEHAIRRVVHILRDDSLRCEVRPSSLRVPA